MLEFLSVKPSKSKKISLQHIFQLQELLQQEPPNDISLEAINYHSEGIYLRELPLVPGMYYVGKIHAHRHFNILLEGSITIWTVMGRQDLIGPCIFESMAGIKKVVYAYTPARFMTVHSNPSNERCEESLEAMYIVPEEQLTLFPELDNLLLGEDK